MVLRWKTQNTPVCFSCRRHEFNGFCQKFDEKWWKIRRWQK